jgi:hypothetical protein
MTTSKWLTCALISACLLMGVTTTRADVNDPAELANECIAKAVRTANLTLEANHITADRASWRIRLLLRRDQPAAARKLAGQAVGGVRKQSAQGIDAIQAGRKECVQALREMGHPKLAARVMVSCTRQVDRVRDSRTRAIGRILAPFGGQ